MLHIVFVEPEIPYNTGNLIRTCACTNTMFHVVHPIPFDLNDDKKCKRAGLDYWDRANFEEHESLDAFMKKYGPDGEFPHRIWLATTKGVQRHTDVKYQDEDMILFGKETAGLPKPFIAEYKEFSIRIPMSESTVERSINLSNSANIILYEALRQLDFPGLR